MGKTTQNIHIMKKFTYFLVASIILAVIGCQKPVKKNVLDPEAKIYIRPAAEVKSSENPAHLSAKEIVKQTEDISWLVYNSTSFPVMGFAENQRDTINPKFIFWTDFVINYQDTTLYPTILDGYNMVFRRDTNATIQITKYDTIAYIPNRVIRETGLKIKEAFGRGEYDECYRIFDSAYVFVPITGAEWRALKAEGKQ